MFLKRVFDLFVSTIGILLLSPILLIISILVVTTSKGGVFFRGERVGKNGKLFKILKFRSMKEDSEGKGKWNVGSDDPRVTKFGSFLRKTKLDELPQLFNVFLGQMSLVGPRPELKYYVDMYTEREMPILDLRPGVTDWASMVNFSQYKAFTEAEDSDVEYLENIRPLKLELQLYYRYNRSFLEDLKILFWTGWKIISRTKKLPKKITKIVEDYDRSLDNE